jgi:hypothetical protein
LRHRLFRRALIGIGKKLKIKKWLTRSKTRTVFILFPEGSSESDDYLRRTELRVVAPWTFLYPTSQNDSTLRNYPVLVTKKFIGAGHSAPRSYDGISPDKNSTKYF